MERGCLRVTLTSFRYIGMHAADAGRSECPLSAWRSCTPYCATSAVTGHRQPSRIVATLLPGVGADTDACICCRVPQWPTSRRQRVVHREDETHRIKEATAALALAPNLAACERSKQGKCHNLQSPTSTQVDPMLLTARSL